MKGIYCYTDLKTDEIVYIGKDSRIDKNRRNYDHLNPSKYDEQQINRVLQNTPDRYVYDILCCSNDCDEKLLNTLERGYIYMYNPKFNFTKGGDGISGYTHSEESKQRRREFQTKNYARIVKDGKMGDKQQYAIKRQGKTIKNSIYPHKLVEWFSENYPNEDLDYNADLIENIPISIRITKEGKDNYNRQVYAIVRGNQRLKRSIDVNKLWKWFEKNYPNEYLVNEVRT